MLDDDEHVATVRIEWSGEYRGQQLEGDNCQQRDSGKNDRQRDECPGAHALARRRRLWPDRRHRGHEAEHQERSERIGAATPHDPAQDTVR